MKIRETWNKYYNDERYTTYMDVGLFVTLILSFHFIYLLWQHFGYYPIGDVIDLLLDKASALLYRQADWCLSAMGVSYTLDPPNQGFIAYDKDGGIAAMAIAPICSSLKQWCHWIFLMLLFPGPWRHKAWFIPAGLVVVELTNVVRVCGIFLCMLHFPGSFQVAHDYIFKFFFYFVIFIMWVIWVEKFVHRKNTTPERQECS